MRTPKPNLGFWQLWNMSFGFFGIQIGFALQGANVSRIFQTLGADINDLPILWIAGPATGLLVQPIIGYLSDRTWGPLGRRRPYFLVGAIACSLALVAFPNVSALWMAAGLLWILDASLNVSMEPFRAFVGDKLNESQRVAGFAFQTMFIGVGSVLAALAPMLLTEVFGVANTAPEGQIPDSVRWAFYLGAGAILFAILWTVISSREYSPQELQAFDGTPIHTEASDEREAAPARFAFAWMAIGAAIIAAVVLLKLDNPLYILGGGLFLYGLVQALNKVWVGQSLIRGKSPLNHILADLAEMPLGMRRLAVVHFLSWFALFVMWIFSTPIVTGFHFGSSDTQSAAYNAGANWVGVMFATYNLVSAVYAFVLPGLCKRFGLANMHAFNLAAGGAGLISFLAIPKINDFSFEGLRLLDPSSWASGLASVDPSMFLLLLPMVGIGFAWASILTVPYSILCGVLPSHKFGIYMGLFNIFIVAPQLVVSTAMGAVGRNFYPTEPIVHAVIGGGFLLAAAIAALLLLNRKAE